MLMKKLAAGKNSHKKHSFLPGQKTSQAWSSDVASVHSVPPLATPIVGLLSLVWSPVPSRSLQDVAQSDQLAHIPITQLTKRCLI